MWSFERGARVLRRTISLHLAPPFYARFPWEHAQEPGGQTPVLVYAQEKVYQLRYPPSPLLMS